MRIHFMPVAIRLSRFGSKSKPFYRMVVLDSRKKRDGAYIEDIGTFDGLKGTFVAFSPERFDAWVAQGAQPSATAKKLYRQYKKANDKTVKQAAEPRQKEQKKAQSPTNEVKAQ